MQLFLRRFDIFLSNRMFWVAGLLVFAFILAYPFPFLLPLAYIMALSFGLIGLVELLLLIVPSKPLLALRRTMVKWSLGDENKVTLEIKNNQYFFWNCEIIDELPIEFQKRDFKMGKWLEPKENAILEYFVKPIQRGEYHFRNLNVLITTPLGFFKRRIVFNLDTKVAVYPSVLQMKRYAMYSVNRLSNYYGVKKLRRIGHSYEFEQIKDYVQGDDMRQVNWKATGRASNLKTNHYIEEKSQPVYCIIDKSRNMNLAFDGMRMLDYAINASLVILNSAIQKGDRAGLITFSDKIGTGLRAENSPAVMGKILNALYIQKYRQTEPDFEFLFNAIKRIVNSRSLVFLFTNFESMTAMERVLPILRKLNYNHLLVVILFQNRELEKYAYEASTNVLEVYQRMAARQMLNDKLQMAATLNLHGIQCVLSDSANITIDTLNKYIELKAKGLI